MLAPPPLPRNLEASFRDLDSKSADVRASAVEDLVRHARRDEAVRARALPLLISKLSDEAPRPRAAAAVALGDLDATSAVPELLRAVDDDDAYVRQMALNALGELADERALPRLRRALADSRPEMRYQAIIAFARVCSDEAEVARALLAATNDDDDAVAHIALRVAEEDLDRGKKPDARLVTRARTLLESGSPHLALVAAIVLAKAGEDAGHSMLLAVVRGEKVRGVAPEKEDERAAVELVGELGLTAARPFLEKRAWGLARHVKDTCAFHARIALARMNHPRAIAEIVKDLDDEQSAVRSGAVVAAGRARIVSARAAIERLTAASVDPELVREALARLVEPGAEGRG